MSSSSHVVLSDSVDYKPVVMHSGRYRQRALPLNNIPAASVAITATGSQLVEWKIPANTVFNPSRSTMPYQLTIPVQAAGTCVFSFEDTYEICNSIQFSSAAQPGLLMDLNFANNYVSVARKIDIGDTDFESLDYTSGLYCSDATVRAQTAAGAAAAAAARSNYFPPTSQLLANNPYGLAAGTYTDQLVLEEPQYARSADALNTAMTLTRIIPFSALTHTALGIDKDYVFGEDMYIRMMIAPSYKIGYTTSTAGNPTGGIPLSVQPTITGLTLNLAIQVDPVIEEAVRAKFQRGDMKFFIPYQYGWRYATAGAGQISIQQQLNNGYGKRLKRVLQIPMDGTEPMSASASKAYDHQNFNSDKITQYQTLLNSVPLQDQQVVTASMDDYRLNQEFIKGSAIRGSASYYHNWFHMDSFSNPKHCTTADVLQENVLEGLDLSMPITWTFTATAAKALTNYTFAEFIREVHAKPNAPVEVLVA
ncbi:MAG: hypothetical protein P4L81_03895 [Candidatus Pacebacteria bacterium]|nr:hypothetical protein [Candidatus Paceibacterota bacterium]